MCLSRACILGYSEIELKFKNQYAHSEKCIFLVLKWRKLKKIEKICIKNPGNDLIKFSSLLQRRPVRNFQDLNEFLSF